MDAAVAHGPKAQMRAPGIAAITASSASCQTRICDTGTETSLDRPALRLQRVRHALRMCQSAFAEPRAGNRRVLHEPFSKACSISVVIIRSAVSAESEVEMSMRHTSDAPRRAGRARRDVAGRELTRCAASAEAGQRAAAEAWACLNSVSASPPTIPANATWWPSGWGRA